MVKIEIKSSTVIETYDTKNPLVRKFIYPTAEEQALIRMMLARAEALMANY